MSVQRKSTERMELVETHNLALSFRRLSESTPYDCDSWKRALMHALLMSQVATREEQKLIREALSLP